MTIPKNNFALQFLFIKKIIRNNNEKDLMKYYLENDITYKMLLLHITEIKKECVKIEPNLNCDKFILYLNNNYHKWDKLKNIS